VRIPVVLPSPSYYAPPTRPSWSAGGVRPLVAHPAAGRPAAGSLDGFVEAVPCRTRLLNGERSSPSPARPRSKRGNTLSVATSSSATPGTTGRVPRGELCDLLVSLGATVWFSEKDV